MGRKSMTASDAPVEKPIAKPEDSPAPPLPEATVRQAADRQLIGGDPSPATSPQKVPADIAPENPSTLIQKANLEIHHSSAIDSDFAAIKTIIQLGNQKIADLIEVDIRQFVDEGESQGYAQ